MAQHDTDPTELTSHDTVPAGFHDAETPVGQYAAADAADHAWPNAVWLVLWSDGTVDCYEDESCGNIFAFWSEQEPMKLSEGERCWPVAKREIVL